MDGFLYTAIAGDFNPTVALTVILIASLIAIFKLSVRFDANKFLEARKERHARLARINCTHMNLESRGDGVEITSLWYSPSGTLDYVCSRCGAVTHAQPDEEQIKRMAEYYVRKPDEYRKRMKRFIKHAKKSY